MRISTNTIFESGSSKLADLQAGMVKTQQQLSTQRRILTPADDPVGAAGALRVSQSLAMNDQYGVNRQNAKNALSETESVLQSVTSLLQDVKTVVVNAGNGALDDQQRQYMAAELKGRFDELMGLANSRNGAGDYMFGGFQIQSPPFSKVSGGAQYNGDQGQRLLQVGPSRQIALNDSGSSVFEANRTGNGTFVTAAAPGNTGSGIISGGAVVDGSQLTGRSYTVAFTANPAGGMDYTIDDATNPPLVPPFTPITKPYVSGEAISVSGMQFDITGAPASNDTFTVTPSSRQSIFQTLDNLLTTLGTNSSGAAGQAKLTNGLNAANTNIDNALDNLLDVRASVGTRLKELDALDSSGSDLNIQYTENLHQLQDIDLTETISSFTQQQMTLEAAQKSFLTVSKLSLFDLI